MSDQKSGKEETKYQTMAEFLESAPPNQTKDISDIAIYATGGVYKMLRPEIELHCNHERCKGTRFFRSTQEDVYLRTRGNKDLYLYYFCSNCRETRKVFSLSAIANDDGLIAQPVTGVCFKYGECPSYGPHVPSKLIRLISPDRDVFLKGRRCENQGLGIASFIYYRRVVENQKNQILERVIKVSETIGAPQEKIENLRNAVH